MNVSDKIAHWLAENGIHDAFGITGSGVIALFDAIARHKKTRIHCFHQEQAAAQAACFYHKTTGKNAAVLVTTGAGSSNAVTGILSAWMDSLPLLVIAGNEPTHFIEQSIRVKGAQGYDFAGSVECISKWQARLRPHKADLIESYLHFGFETMTQDRQGPVVLEIPVDLQNKVVQ